MSTLWTCKSPFIPQKSYDEKQDEFVRCLVAFFCILMDLLYILKCYFLELPLPEHCASE